MYYVDTNPDNLNFIKWNTREWGVRPSRYSSSLSASSSLHHQLFFITQILHTDYFYMLQVANSPSIHQHIMHDKYSNWLHQHDSLLLLITDSINYIILLAPLHSYTVVTCVGNGLEIHHQSSVTISDDWFLPINQSLIMIVTKKVYFSGKLNYYFSQLIIVLMCNYTLTLNELVNI